MSELEQGVVREVNARSWHEIWVGDPEGNMWLQYRDGCLVAVNPASSPRAVWIPIEPSELREAIGKLLDAVEGE